jgi:hypothetical protein
MAMGKASRTSHRKTGKDVPESHVFSAPHCRSKPFSGKMDAAKQACP